MQQRTRTTGTCFALMMLLAAACNQREEERAFSTADVQHLFVGGQ
jgi:hypothetical protein